MINLLLTILVINLIADSLLQPRQVLHGKNDSTPVMVIHVFIWSIPMALFTWLVVYQTGSLWALKWYCVIVPMHFFIDWPISRRVNTLMRGKDYVSAIRLIHTEKALLNLGLLLTFLFFSA
jgi:hypothetical protein